MIGFQYFYILTLMALLSCSQGEQFKGFDNVRQQERGSQVDESPISEGSGEEEEITAIPPTIISGSYLTCHITEPQEDSDEQELQCQYFDGEGRSGKFKEVEGIDSQGSDLEVIQEDGQAFSLKLSGFTSLESEVVQINIYVEAGLFSFEIPAKDLESSRKFAPYKVAYDVEAVENDSVLIEEVQESDDAEVGEQDDSEESDDNEEQQVSQPAEEALNLTSVCSDDPEEELRWRVTNPNPYAVDINWLVAGSDLRGNLQAPPGQSHFFTDSLGLDSPNTTIIRWLDSDNIEQQKTKASGKAVCQGSD